MENEAKFLKDSELREIEGSHYEQRICEKDLTIAKLKKEKADIELKLMSSNYLLKQQQIQELSASIKSSENLLNKRKEKGKELIGSIGEVYDLENKWGYDPITGEINE